MSRNHISALLSGIGLLLAFVLARAVFPSAFFRAAVGNMVPLLIILAAFAVSARNAHDSRGHTRFFWGLMATGMAMWSFNQAAWTWFEVITHQPLPDAFFGDIVLFLHVVPIMAAVAIRPHQADERDGMLPSADRKSVV